MDVIFRDLRFSVLSRIFGGVFSEFRVFCGGGKNAFVFGVEEKEMETLAFFCCNDVSSESSSTGLVFFSKGACSSFVYCRLIRLRS